MSYLSAARPRLTVKAASVSNNHPLKTLSPPRFERKTIFGTDGQPDQVSLYDQVADDGGGPRLWCPCLSPSIPIEDYHQQPLMLYLPGFDGSGWAASRQFPRLMQAFEFLALTIPIDDDRSFSDHVNIIVEDFKNCTGDIDKRRPIYLLGESFGALLALALAHRCPDVVDRVVLVNPATSYDRSIWPLIGPLLPRIPDELYTALSFAIGPLLGNPVSLAAYKLDTDLPLSDQLESVLEGLSELIGTMFFVGDIFNPRRVGLKLRLVEQGMEATSRLIPKIQQRTLLVVGDGDWMLPSANEKDRLSRLMPRCYVRSMGPRSHALLQEFGIDLAQIIKEEGFYVTQRQFTSRNGKEPELNRFGTASPIELPTEIEAERISSMISRSSVFTSPVFYSTDENKRVMEGLKGLPDVRPLLIVGNHQLMATDTSMAVQHILKEKGILVRGLIHPFVTDDLSVTPGRQQRIVGWSQTVGNFLSTFGAVRVRPRSLHTLLSNGEWILLYPGGARESFHLKNEGYRLFWSENPEFVRMAAKFGATIVTMAAVGLEESLDIVMDREDLLKMPIVNEYLRNQLRNIPEARPGISAQNGDLFLPPIVRPRVPHRQYFLFGKPFEIPYDCYEDKQKADALYNEIKTQLEENIVYLQTKAKEDPYGDLLKRVMYETANRRQRAPSFVP